MFDGVGFDSRRSTLEGFRGQWEGVYTPQPAKKQEVKEEVLDLPEFDYLLNHPANLRPFKYGTGTSSLKYASRPQIKKLLQSYENMFLLDPQYLQPTLGRYAVKALQTLNDGFFIVFVLYLMVGLMVACAWFSLMQFEAVRDEIRSHNFSQAFYAIIILLAIVVGVRFKKSISVTAKRSAKYLKLIKSIQWLSTLITANLKVRELKDLEIKLSHQTTRRGTFRQLKVCLQTLAYHSYTCMSLRDFVLDYSYFQYGVYKGEALVNYGYPDNPTQRNSSGPLIPNLESGVEDSYLYKEYNFLIGIDINSQRKVNTNHFRKISTILGKNSSLWSLYKIIPDRKKISKIKKKCLVVTNKDTIFYGPPSRTVMEWEDTRDTESMLHQSRRQMLGRLRSLYTDIELEMINERLEQNAQLQSHPSIDMHATNLNIPFSQPGDVGFGKIRTIRHKYHTVHFCIRRALDLCTSTLEAHQVSLITKELQNIYNQFYDIWIDQTNLQPDIFNKIFTIAIYVFLLLMVPLQILSNTNEYWGLGIIPAVFLIYMLPSVASSWFGDPFNLNRERDHVPTRSFRSHLCKEIENNFENINMTVSSPTIE